VETVSKPSENPPSPMPLHPTYAEIALRLLLSFAAGAVIGLNREERGSTAGLRTTILVCLAAAVAMIQANLLLAAAGKSPDSFVVLDLMRLPLGILSGMGFIGAGAILRRDNLVRGTTTAATLWFVTVIGLCFGGGQIGLGLDALGMAAFVLWALKWLEKKLHSDRQATLVVEIEGDRPGEEDIRQDLEKAGLRILACAVARSGARRSFAWTLSWRERRTEPLRPAVIGELDRDMRVANVEWRPAGFASVRCHGGNDPTSAA
jgi:putative Mg2+ transporter-C (MgtC) family protein